MSVSNITLVNPTFNVEPVRINFKIVKNKVHQGAFLQTCIIYKNGESLLDRHLISWKYDSIGIQVASNYNLSEVSAILVSPSYGEWEVPSVWLTDEDGNRQEFVATNTEGNCMFGVPEPLLPPSQEKIDEGMQEYVDMKKQIFQRNLACIGVSAIAIHSIDTTDIYTKWFALGGGVGLMYQLLMQIEIDQVGSPEKGIIYRLLANSFSRLGLITGVFLLTAVDTEVMDTSTFAAILAGFMMNKVAMYTTFWNMKK